MQMFEAVEGKFWTGTGNDDTRNTSSVPLDAQLWAVLALGESAKYGGAIDWDRPLRWVESHLQTTDGPYSGFTFSTQTTPDRVWFEGTAQAAAVYAVRGDWARYAATLQKVEFARLRHAHADGRGVVAASADNTVDSLLDATYDARLHTGATAWLVLAEQLANPFVTPAGHDATAPQASLDAPAVVLPNGQSYHPGVDPQPGVNLVSWYNFGATGADKWKAAVQDAYDNGYRSVSLVPVRYVDLTTGAIGGGEKSPEIAHIAARNRPGQVAGDDRYGQPVRRTAELHDLAR